MSQQQYVSIPVREQQEYAKRHEQIEQWLCESPEDGGWRFKSRQHEVDLYTKSIRSTISGKMRQATKGVGLMQFPALLCAAIVEETAKKDEHYDQYRCIVRYDRAHATQYSSFKGIYGSKPRDFVIHTRRLILQSGNIVMSSYSVEHADCPARSTHIRAELLVGAFMFQPLTKHTCRAYYLVSFDPLGSFPTFAVNLVSSKQPLLIDKLRKRLNDPEQYRNAIQAIQQKPILSLIPTHQEDSDSDSENDSDSSSDEENEDISEVSNQSKSTYYHTTAANIINPDSIYPNNNNNSSHEIQSYTFQQQPKIVSSSSQQHQSVSSPPYKSRQQQSSKGTTSRLMLRSQMILGSVLHAIK